MPVDVITVGNSSRPKWWNGPGDSSVVDHWDQSDPQGIRWCSIGRALSEILPTFQRVRSRLFLFDRMPSGRPFGRQFLVETAGAGTWIARAHRCRCVQCSGNRSSVARFLHPWAEEEEEFGRWWWPSTGRVSCDLHRPSHLHCLAVGQHVDSRSCSRRAIVWSRHKSSHLAASNQFFDVCHSATTSTCLSLPHVRRQSPLSRRIGLHIMAWGWSSSTSSSSTGCLAFYTIYQLSTILLLGSFFFSHWQTTNFFGCLQLTKWVPITSSTVFSGDAHLRNRRFFYVEIEMGNLAILEITKRFGRDQILLLLRYYAPLECDTCVDKLKTKWQKKSNRQWKMSY